MIRFVRRTCTEISVNGPADAGNNPTRPLEDYREKRAYVLLGAPGAGKTTAFEREAENTGGHCISARDFIDLDAKPEWRRVTLFIDGLDETGARPEREHTRLGTIRRKLQRLGCPRFRLSCREADWFGANDRDRLKAVSGNGQVTVMRLDLLGETGVRTILDSYPQVEDAQAFINSARAMGVEDLLGNPQSLQMLAQAVSGGKWPESRMETLDMACRELLREHNEEHRIATSRTGFATDVMLNAAGRLCAALLLADKTGYALASGGDRDHVYLECLPGDDRTLLLHVLGSKLFVSPTGGATEPVHRQIAEFMGGRYLAGLVSDGLPVERILALMAGHDGGIVSGLRGLAAWLAAHAKPARRAIVQRDPMGATLYGDVRGFSADEKLQLLRGLLREARKNPRFGIHFPNDSRLADIAIPLSNSVFSELLADRTRDAPWQTLTHLLWDSLSRTRAMPELPDLAMEVVRDETRWPGTRREALEAFCRHGRNGRTTILALEALRGDIEAGAVSDPNDDLTGVLLRQLYPGTLSVRDITHYLRRPKVTGIHGAYSYFWRIELPRKSSSDEIFQLLDTIVARYDELAPLFADLMSPFRALPERLFLRLLETAGNEAPPELLLDYLGILSDDSRAGLESGKEFIRNWLRTHPDAQKAMIAIGVNRCTGLSGSGFCKCIYRVEERLFGTRPPDFGIWCLDRAVEATDSDAENYFIREAADSLHLRCHDEGLSRETAEEHLAARPDLRHRFLKRLDGLEEGARHEATRRNRSEMEADSRMREWRESVAEHEGALRDNRCPAWLLDRLAHVYFGQFVDVSGIDPHERLRNLLGADLRLVDAVLDGLRGCVLRRDLPDAREIFRLAAKGQRHRLALPFLAGLGLRLETDPQARWPFDEIRAEQAMAFHFATPHSDDPKWPATLSESHPDIVADMLIRFARLKRRLGKHPPLEFHDLPDHPELARRATIPLLKNFPVRCTAQQLPALKSLLVAALLHSAETSLVETVGKKLDLQGMNVGQRVYWLAAGTLAAAGIYGQRLQSHTSGKERRLRHLAGFFHRLPIATRQFLDVRTLDLLVRLLGPIYRPLRSEEGPRWITPAMEAADRVQEFIDYLASFPTPDVSNRFRSLSSDETLRPWHLELAAASFRQNILRREAEFRYSTVNDVLATLDNRRPANAADLAALTTGLLRRIAREIRDGNASGWRQYWNVDPRNRPVAPRPENSNRDALLEALRAKLESMGIDVEPEVRHADDKRADIRISFRDFNVPIEIKRSCHRDLWSAIRSQLIAKYARDPGADGHGIYVVFWFGPDRCQPPESGRKPATANKLETQLRAVVPEEHAHAISVCVIDVARP